LSTTGGGARSRRRHSRDRNAIDGGGVQAKSDADDKERQINAGQDSYFSEMNAIASAPKPMHAIPRSHDDARAKIVG
jgi:hypothetical protein